MYTSKTMWHSCYHHKEGSDLIITMLYDIGNFNWTDRSAVWGMSSDRMRMWQTEQIKISVSMLASCSILPLDIMYRQNCYQLSYSDLTHKATEYTLAPQTSHYFWTMMLAWRSMPSVRYKYITSRCAIIDINISYVV